MKLERASRTIWHVFQTSADCCRDLEERDQSESRRPAIPGFESKLNLTQSQKDRLAAAEQGLADGLIAHEKMREFWEPGEWIGARPTSFDQLTEVRKLDRDIRDYMRAVMNVIAEASLAAATENEVRECIESGAAAHLSAAYARVNNKDLPFLDNGSIGDFVNSMCAYLTQRATAKHQSLRHPKPKFGQVVESNFQYDEFPKVRYHWVKKEITVKDAEEELALSGGWGDLADFAPYRTPRVSPADQQQLTKWVDGWFIDGLTGEHIRRIKAQLLRADSAFWSSPERDSADLSAMKLAFDGVAKVLFDGGILTRENLQGEIPILIWDAAIAGGWYRFASEVAKKIFPERIGHYFVWRDDTKDWNALFRAETGKWLAELLDKPNKTGDGAVRTQVISTELSDASPDRSPDVPRAQSELERNRLVRDPLDDPALRPLPWSRFQKERSSMTSTFVASAANSQVSFSIPAPHTHRDVVARIAKECQIPIESLADELDQPIFTRGQAISNYAGDALNAIARNYSLMRWWISDVGLNLGMVSSDEARGKTPEAVIAERADRRQAVVMPILTKRGWKRGRLVTAAGVGKNSVYEYLDGTRATITDENREAIAQALGLEKDELPD
jgi:hypothetical protein